MQLEIPLNMSQKFQKIPPPKGTFICGSMGYLTILIVSIPEKLNPRDIFLVVEFIQVLH